MISRDVATMIGKMMWEAWEEELEEKEPARKRQKK